MKNTLLLLAAIFGYLFSAAQGFQYRNYNFEWAPGQPPVIPVEEQFKNEDAVILDEKLIFNASGNTVPPYQFLNSRGSYFYIDESTNGVSPIVQKHVRIKFLTQHGIKKYSQFVLPESFDPISDLSTVRIEDRDSIYRPKGEFDCIRYFAARIIKPDGKISMAVLDEKTQLEIDRHNKISSKLYSWIFRVINLEPGDELELDYSYEGAFNYDPGSRIFFNGLLPKQNFHLTFRYSELEYYVITYSNGANPTDSVMETKTRPKYTEYYFSAKNLPGGLREVGGRPQTQYPYITFYEHKRDFGIINPRTKFISKPLPYPWSFVALPLVGYQYESLKLRLARKDNSTVVMNDFLKAEMNKVNDTSLAVLMSSVQHTLAEDFSYQSDKGAFEGDDQENEHLGKYVENKAMREMSRYRIYYELFLREDKDYYASLFCDKRISQIDMNEYKNSSSFRLGYAVQYNGKFIYLYPKSYRFGYEANELPFYYEDIQSILIPQHEIAEKKYDLFPAVNFTFVKTPFSSVKDNIRITSSLVNVSLDSMSLLFNARIKLSGQFSTIMRGYYLYGDKDTTVNPSYFNSIASIADDVKHLQVSVTSTSKQFPYDASVSINLSNHTAVTKEADGNYSIDLDGWFNNVIDDDFSSANRHLDYYPDFQFQDSHKYMLKFDKKIQVLNTAELQKTINNGFTEYSIKITQTDESSVMIETSYVVKPEYAPAEHAKDVQDVFDAIKNLNNSSLKIKTL
ncbi:MAG: DUF3857 domain-containing protein [Bacteroidetes bacterium]|nr:DUF3857 domain-containing protein [Bacteroidota bacterium]